MDMVTRKDRAKPMLHGEICLLDAIIHLRVVLYCMGQGELKFVIGGEILLIFSRIWANVQLD